MVIPATTSPEAITVFVVATTQIFKDLGVGGDAYGIQGFYLKAVAALAGIAAALLANFEPALWTSIYIATTGTTVTGAVSFLHDLITKVKQPVGVA